MEPELVLRLANKILTVLPSSDDLNERKPQEPHPWGFPFAWISAVLCNLTDVRPSSGPQMRRCKAKVINFAHQIYSIAIRDFHGSEPLSHMLMELVGGMLGGSLLLCTIGWFRNQKVAKQERTVEKAASKPEA